MPQKPKLPLHQSRLFKVSSPERLALVLGLPFDQLRSLLALNPRYREFDRPKKTEGVRHCEDPVPPLKALHGRLAKMLARIEAPDFLFCPVKGRCYISNAAAHRHSRVVHCLDIKKFFPNTPSRRVFWFFHRVMQCRRDVAGLLTDLTTFNGRLPTGSPLSPILAYFSFHDMWAGIEAFCHSKGYVLTVYIDDVTVSGLKVPAADLWVIKGMIKRYGLEYHKEKTFIDRPAEISGGIVSGGRLSAPHREDLMRQGASEQLRIAGDPDGKLRSRIGGLHGQISQIAKAQSSVVISCEG